MSKSKKKREKNNKTNITRYNPKPDVGLTNAQVEERTQNNLLNISTVKTNKTIGGIFAKNIFTFFNMTCLLVAIALMVVNAYSDMLFMVIVIWFLLQS